MPKLSKVPKVVLCFIDLLLFHSRVYSIELFCFSAICTQAETQADAEDGIKFMQEMIELAKQRNDESGIKYIKPLKLIRLR